MKLTEFIKALGSISKDDKMQTFDLTTKEGYEGFKNLINELREEDPLLFELLDVDMDEFLDSAEELGKTIYEQNNDRKSNKEIIKDAVAQIENKVIDHTEDVKEKDENPKFNRPSDILSIPQKMQLHKIVEEYVNTMIRPYNNGALSNDQINDAYAGLYEFAAWVLNR